MAVRQGVDGAFDQLFDQAFELGAGQFHVQVLGPGRIGGDVGQVDVGLRAAGEFDLGLFSGFLEALKRQYVLAQVDALLLVELGDDEVDDALVKVFAAQEGIAVGRQHFELLLAVDVGDFDDGHVEGAATQVVHGDLAVALFTLVQAKGQRSCGGFVDDALDIQPGNAAQRLVAWRWAVIEVRGHRDDRLGDGLAQVVLGGLLPSCAAPRR